MPRWRLRLSTLALLIVIIALTLGLLIQQHRLRAVERELNVLIRQTDVLKRRMEMEGVILSGSGPRLPVQPAAATPPVGTHR